MEKHDLRS